MNEHPEHPERLYDEQAGPLVRPYVMTRGRIVPARTFDPISLVVTTQPPPTPSAEAGLGPEHHAIIRLCDQPYSVVEIAARLDLPAGTVRVLVGDLLDKAIVDVQDPEPEVDMHDIRMYEAVLDGLRAL